MFAALYVPSLSFILHRFASFYVLKLLVALGFAIFDIFVVQHL